MEDVDGCRVLVDVWSNHPSDTRHENDRSLAQLSVKDICIYESASVHKFPNKASNVVPHHI